MRVLALILALAMAVPAVAQQPNILLFLVDDLGWQDTSEPFHTEPTEWNRRYRTPNVERLADMGIKFTNAYSSSPVCTPTRTSLMSGKAPGRTRITYWTARGDTSANHPTLKAPRWEWEGLQPEDGPTLPQILQASGYRTMHVGKAHFGFSGSKGADPRNLGFEINIAGSEIGHPGSFLGIHHFQAAKQIGGSEKKAYNDVPGLEKYHGQDIYLTDALTQEALPHIRQAARDHKPLFVNFAPYAVHTPIMANPALVDKYSHLPPREAAYASMIESYDIALGRLMREFSAAFEGRETIVIFFSDNGGLSAHARAGEPHIHNMPLRSGKGSWHEGGIRVPLIISRLGAKDAEVADQPVIAHDLMPTILGMAGLPLPSGIDGERIVDSELTVTARDQRSLTWHMPHKWGPTGPGIAPFSAIRRGDWKLIYRHADQGFELYNLRDDIGEMADLAERRPVTVRRLARELQAQLESQSAQMSIMKSTGQPVALPMDALNARS